MQKARRSTTHTAARWYRGDQVPMSAIRRFAREVAERFQPEKIILFGSHAYGTPDADSDVDVLVVMPARNQLDQAVRICSTVKRNFPLDLIVRTPRNLASRVREGDWFLREITSRGRVLYEKADACVGAKGRRRHSGVNHVETRYPGEDATSRQAQSALRWAGRVRDACRDLLGIRRGRK